MNINFTASMTHGLSFDSYKGYIMHKSNTQSNNRLDIVTEVCHKLDGDALKDALFIIDNIRENKMKIKWSSGNTWSVSFRRKHVCDIRIVKDSLTIGPVNDVLITRVKNISRNQDSIEKLIKALKNSMPCTEEAFALPN